MNGVINVYKEKGWTSFDVVAKLRRVLGERKIGHTGTLDPDAEGVLPVCVGKATKLCDLLTEKQKSYRAVLLLGKKTDTQDITGQVLEEHEVDCNMSKEQIEEILQSFVGSYMQVPPMYSALKVNGKKLYELAREGKTVERKAREVHFYKITLDDVNLPEVTFTVTCSKGTYIRTLCEDIGEKIGCGGCMKQLLRTESGQFVLEESYRIAQIEEMVANGQLEQVLQPIDQIFSHLPQVCLPEKYDKLLHNGNALDSEGIKQYCQFDKTQIQQFRVYDSKGCFIGLYEWKTEEPLCKLVKMFLTI